MFVKKLIDRSNGRIEIIGNRLLFHYDKEFIYELGFITNDNKIHLYDPTGQYYLHDLSLREIEYLITSYHFIVNNFSEYLD